MTDTARTKASLASTYLADNTAGDISAQDVRDLMESVANPIGASGFMYGTYQPDAPPESANGNDDEFNDNSIGGSWTEWDFGSSNTQSEDAYGVKITSTSATTGGLYRTLPASPWAITTKVAMIAPKANYPKVGIGLLQDATSSSGDYVGFTLGQQAAGNPGRIQVETFSDYQTFTSAQAQDNTTATSLYMRIRRNGTLYSFDWSDNGIAWVQMYSSTIGFTPSHIALIVNSLASNTVIGRYRFYRQTADNTLDQVLLGRNLQA